MRCLGVTDAMSGCNSHGEHGRAIYIGMCEMLAMRTNVYLPRKDNEVLMQFLSVPHSIACTDMKRNTKHASATS